MLQVVQATTTTNTTNSTTTYADTTLSATITPSAATSKILIMTMHPSKKSDGSGNNGIFFRIMRDATQIFEQRFAIYTPLTTLSVFVLSNMTYLDSPSTTSATTYKTQFCNNIAGADVQVQHNSETATMILMEIGA